MQHVGEPGTPEMKSDDKPSGGLSPVKAFFALLALLVAIGGLFLLTRPTDESNPGPAPRSDNFALTDAEAIERFKELERLDFAAYEQRDATLLATIFTSDSPARRTALQEIQRLRRARVTPDVSSETKEIDIIQNEPEEIRLRQVVLLDVHFFDQAGKDVTTSGGLERQTLMWTLHKEASAWLIHDSELTASTQIRDA